MPSSRGFTLAELVIALGLMLIVSAGVAVVVMHSLQVASAQSRIVDTQQVARVLTETLVRDLRQAGAGMDNGPAVGPLHRWFPPIWPRRIGRIRADPVSVVRRDAITIVHVPESAVQTWLVSPVLAGSSRLGLSPCVGGAVPCAVARGDTLALFDTPGRVDFLGVTGTLSDSVLIQPLGTSAGDFEAGALVGRVVIRTYYFDAARSQVRSYDADSSDQPVVDGVSSLSFEYFGDPAPPVWPRPPAGQENCLYSTIGEAKGGATLLADDTGLAPLPLNILSDGPWCGAGGGVFDADLLRIRRVRVVALMRSPDTTSPGQDYRVVFDVAPRNLGLALEPGREESW